MTRIRLCVEYDGRPYMGWQRQAHGPSVQQALEQAIHSITGEQVTVEGAGRTDAGVHASAMTAHADIAAGLTPFRLMEAMNARLRLAGERIAILAAATAAADFHARFSCIGRAYQYRIVCRRAPLSWEQGLAWRHAPPLDVAAMQRAAAVLVGRHDFSAFRSAHCQAKSPLRTLDALQVRAHGARITIDARARSFLHHQVRFMVGALVLAGRGRIGVADVEAVLARGDQRLIRFNVPPDGLWFQRAIYPETV